MQKHYKIIKQRGFDEIFTDLGIGEYNYIENENERYYNKDVSYTWTDDAKCFKEQNQINFLAVAD
ncbi:MAG: hypothetical protein WC940_02365 [Candidatus Paceibacterota bacterium]|jgi:hypothetical protein